MNYVVTGASGNIGTALTKKLLAASQDVVVIGRNQSNLNHLADAGATTAIGSMEDVEFLTRVFNDAHCVFCMYPPVADTNDFKSYTEEIANNYKQAISANNIKHIVHLSSIGAHLAENAGPVSGIHRAEKVLDTLTDVNILHLRPAYFYTNLFANLSTLQQLGIMGGTFTSDALPLAHYDDIANIASEALLKCNFKGHEHQYIVSDIASTSEIASQIGKSIGKSDVPWIRFSHDQALEAICASGIPRPIAIEYLELFAAVDSGLVTEDYLKHPTTPKGVSLDEFSRQFAAVYNLKIQEPVNQE
ncbi:MAG: NAD(P)H-binding protein [Chitinophagaceae bacterium]|nr:NAD(P)H-binding protein [Chitinophagaceae bacterium]